MTPLRSTLPSLACALVVACGGDRPASRPAPAPARARDAAPARVPVPVHPGSVRTADKPHAPIDLTMEARPLDSTATADRFEVVLHATPRGEVQHVELAVDGQPSVVATATAGAVSDARATVEVARGEGKDVIGTAVVTVDGKRMGAATQVRVGAPAADEPTGAVLTLPDGTQVQEVRP